MNNENIAMTCTNCKYFQRYYVIGTDCSFKPTALGHCIHSKINCKVADKHVRKDEGCELWQPYELQKLYRQYGVEILLSRIDATMDSILALLRDAE